MTTREALHQLVDELPEDQAELAHAWLQDLRDAPDEDGPPLDPRRSPHWIAASRILRRGA